MVHEADFIMTDSRGTLWYAADEVEAWEYRSILIILRQTFVLNRLICFLGYRFGEYQKMIIVLKRECDYEISEILGIDVRV